MYLFAGSSDNILFKVLENDQVVVVYAHCCLDLSDFRSNLYIVLHFV